MKNEEKRLTEEIYYYNTQYQTTYLLQCNGSKRVGIRRPEFSFDNNDKKPLEIGVFYINVKMKKKPIRIDFKCMKTLTARHDMTGNGNNNAIKKMFIGCVQYTMVTFSIRNSNVDSYTDLYDRPPFS